MATNTIAGGAARKPAGIPIRTITDGDLKIALRQGLDDFLDLRGDPAIDADFQIRRCEAKSSGIRTQENVSEDRKTSACRHTAAGERESVREVLLQARDFQVVLPHRPRER